MMSPLLECSTGNMPVLTGRETAFVVIATWVLFGYSMLSIGGNIASRSRHEHRSDARERGS